MQLILDSETDLGLTKKMSALDEESLDEKLVYDDINDVKHCDLPSIDKELTSECLDEKLIYDDNNDHEDITPNSNKENIQSQYNGVVEMDENKYIDTDDSPSKVTFKKKADDETKDDSVLDEENNHTFVSEENKIDSENKDLVLQKEAEILDDHECVKDLISLAAEIRESNEKLNEIDKPTNNDILNQENNFIDEIHNEEQISDENINKSKFPQKNLADIETPELVKEKKFTYHNNDQQEEENLNEVLDNSKTETNKLQMDYDINVNTVSENVTVNKDCLSSSKDRERDDSFKENDKSKNPSVDNSKSILLSDTSVTKDKEAEILEEETSETLTQDLETLSQHQTIENTIIVDDKNLLKESIVIPAEQEMLTEYSKDEIGKSDILVTQSSESNTEHNINNEIPEQHCNISLQADTKETGTSKIAIDNLSTSNESIDTNYGKSNEFSITNFEFKDTISEIEPKAILAEENISETGESKQDDELIDSEKPKEDIHIEKKSLQTDTKETESSEIVTFDILSTSNESIDTNDSKSNDLKKNSFKLKDTISEIKPKEIVAKENISQTEESKQHDTLIDTEKRKDDCLSNSDMELDEPMEIDTTVSNNVILTSPIITDKKEVSILEGAQENKVPKMCKLSNNLDILSDDDEDRLDEPDLPKSTVVNKKSINEEDDDIMLIDEDTNAKNTENVTNELELEKDSNINKITHEVATSDSQEISDSKKLSDTFEKDAVSPTPDIASIKSDLSEKTLEEKTDKIKVQKPLFLEKFFSTCKKNLADMSRNDLEEFCKLKIVESIVDRSSLSELKSKIKTMTHNFDEYKKKTMSLSKQNRDLQVVLKSVQEELKKRSSGSITPLKITRSVGMQILMTEPSRRKGASGTIIPVSSVTSGNTNTSTPNNRQLRNTNQSSRNQKSNNSQQIPVPRLVPATNNLASKTPIAANSNNGKTSSPSPVPNGIKNSSAQKPAEKRGRATQSQSVTVDLTDDEPPLKVPARSPSVPPVRLVPPQNLMAAQRPQFGQQINSPRKVYIPISGPQGPGVRPGQAIMLKSVPAQGPRARATAPGTVARPQQNAVRLPRVTGGRHPAPLPDAMKQYQPPNWKALPPAPDLKLSKVENGIVISWKIEGYQEDSYEEIASYQLYAYQETNLPPSTTLWKKIGDVKALPLPMACTLTQFMAGYKYYFAVRAVDVRSRVGPFSLPGNIVLLSRT